MVRRTQSRQRGRFLSLPRSGDAANVEPQFWPPGLDPRSPSEPERLHGRKISSALHLNPGSSEETRSSSPEYVAVSSSAVP